MKQTKLAFAIALGLGVTASAWGNQINVYKNGALDPAAVCTATATTVLYTGAIEVDVSDCSIWVSETTTDPDTTPPPDDTTPPPDTTLTPGDDPGIGTGLWVSPDYPDTFFVDQSISGGHKSWTTFAPGCVNAKDYSTTQCDLAETGTDYYDGVRYTINTYGNSIVSVRYKPINPAPVIRSWPQRFVVAGWDGGNIGRPADISLSEIPGDFNSPCRYFSEGETALINIYRYDATTPTKCMINPNADIYYLNIRANAGCTGAWCEYKLITPYSILY